MELTILLYLYCGAILNAGQLSEYFDVAVTSVEDVWTVDMKRVLVQRRLETTDHNTSGGT